MKIALTKAISYKDTELHELELDFDALTGNDLVQAEENLRRSKPDAVLWGVQHLAHIAAKAAHIPAEVLMKMAAKDFMKLTAEVMSFFGSTDSEASQQENTGD